MTDATPRARTTLALAALSAGLVGAVALAAVSSGGAAQAATTSIDLGTAGQFVVLAGAPGITNTGSTTIQVPAGIRGDLGTGSGVAIPGSTSITWLNPPPGSFHLGDSVAAVAQDDNRTAYGVAASGPVTSFGSQLDTLTFLPGVHTADHDLDLAVNGTLTLDAQGDPDAEFVIQVPSSLTMGSGSTVQLLGRAQACHVYWQVGQDATIGTSASFAGTLLAENAIVAQNRATIQGRLLAQNASVTLDNNTFVLPTCSTPVGSTGGTGTPTTSAPTSPTPAPTTPPTAGAGTGDSRGGSGSTDDDGDGGADGDASATDTISGDGAGGSGSGTTALPDTGGPSRVLWPIGAAALVAGVGVVMVSRPRRGGHR